MNKIKNVVVIYDIDKKLNVKIKSVVPFANKTSVNNYLDELNQLRLNGLAVSLA